MSLSKTNAAQMAAQTLAIFQAGSYTDSSGQIHKIADSMQAAQQNTRDYRPDWEAAPLPWPRFETQIEVVNETTLRAARRLWDANFDVAALNFASARNAGGGFLSGARAQEEFLCRNSGLYLCLNGRDYYAHHQKHRAPRYSTYALYCPKVPIIRGDHDELRAPWTMAFITSAAPNLNQESVPETELRALFRERIAKVLSIALENGHNALVLGAWGCGAFKNDSRLVADVFAEVVLGDYAGQFERIIFAVLDTGAQKKNFEAFNQRFAR